MRFLTLFAVLFSVSASAEPYCAKDFGSFLVFFQDDEKFQITHTAFPLRYSYVDAAANPEPKTVSIEIINQDDALIAKLPRYPAAETIKPVSLQETIFMEKGEVYVVRFTKPDTDYMFDFRFMKHNNCWQLVEVNNYSL